MLSSASLFHAHTLHPLVCLPPPPSTPRQAIDPAQFLKVTQFAAVATQTSGPVSNFVFRSDCWNGGYAMPGTQVSGAFRNSSFRIFFSDLVGGGVWSFKAGSANNWVSKQEAAARERRRRCRAPACPPAWAPARPLGSPLRCAPGDAPASPPLPLSSYACCVAPRWCAAATFWSLVGAPGTLAQFIGANPGSPPQPFPLQFASPVRHQVSLGRLR